MDFTSISGFLCVICPWKKIIIPLRHLRWLAERGPAESESGLLVDSDIVLSDAMCTKDTGCCGALREARGFICLFLCATCILICLSVLGQTLVGCIVYRKSK